MSKPFTFTSGWPSTHNPRFANIDLHQSLVSGVVKLGRSPKIPLKEREVLPCNVVFALSLQDRKLQIEIINLDQKIGGYCQGIKEQRI